MSIQKIVRVLAVVLLISFASPAGASNTPTLPDPPITDNARAEQIMSRLKVIQSMDVANLSPREKKSLRKELNALKKESQGLSGKGVYLSIGAIIIIILLLILIL